MTGEITLSAGDATLRVRGAEPVSWNLGGRELLWTGGAAWPRSSPLLFPVVGRSVGGEIRVGGQGYPIGVHGFAAAAEFSVTAVDDSSVTFALGDTPSTRRHYPFAFGLEVSYRLTPLEVFITLKVVNPGNVAMPFAIGLHPGFQWPFAAADAGGHAIVFNRDEHDMVPVIDPDGLFTDMRRQVPLAGRRLPLTHELLAQEALCFLDAGSDVVRFVSPSGAAIVVETENFPHLALWSRPPAPFLCIESWTGHGDPQGFAGELAEKPSMRLLQPGESSSHAARWRFEAHEQ